MFSLNEHLPKIQSLNLTLEVPFKTARIRWRHQKCICVSSSALRCSTNSQSKQFFWTKVRDQIERLRRAEGNCFISIRHQREAVHSALDPFGLPLCAFKLEFHDFYEGCVFSSLGNLLFYLKYFYSFRETREAHEK